MVALDLQYTAYKEMLLALAGDKYMNVNGVNNHGVGDGAELLFAEPFPFRASEAYLFSPPGYWKSVYDNPLYPDDFPTDLKSSMSGGATTATIPGSYADGHYLMLYNIWEVWRKVEVDIIDGKVYYVNLRDVSRIPEDVDYMFGESDGFWVDIDINSAIFSDLDSEITIAIEDGSEIDSEIFVTIAGEKDLDTEMFVWNIATTEIDSELWVKERSSIDSEITIKYDCVADLDSAITVKQTVQKDLDSEMFVWFKATADLDSEILVTHDRMLASEILVQQTDKAELPSIINIQRVDETYMDCEMLVLSYGVSSGRDIWSEMIVNQRHDTYLDSEVKIAAKEQSDIDSEFDIERKEIAVEVPAEITIIQCDKSALDIEINVVSASVVEAVVDTRTQSNSSIDTELKVVYPDEAQVDTELTVVPRVMTLETVAGISIEVVTDLDSEITIQSHDVALLDAEITVQAHSVMEAGIGTFTGGREDLDCEITVVRYDSSEVLTELNVTSSNVMEAVGDTKGASEFDLDSEILICVNNRADLDIELMVSTDTVMETVTDTIASRRSDIDSEINIIISQTTEIDAEINVTSVTFFEAVTDTIHSVMVYLDCELTIAHPGQSEIDSEIMITSATLMEAAIGTYNGGVADLDCEIYPAYSEETHIDCEMMVNATNQMETAVFYRNDVYADLDSEIILGVEAQLDTEIYVVYENDVEVMEVAAHTMPAILRHDVTSAVKDAAVYSYTALTNYGTLPEVFVGRFTGGETFKALIGFDLAGMNIPHEKSAPYFGYETIQKAVMKLNITRPMVEAGVVIKVYRVSDAWAENKVNYRAVDVLPVYEYVNQVIAPTKAGTLEIDVTKGFDGWDTMSDKQSFLLVVENPLQATKKGIYFSSKEGMVAPKLEVDFYRTLPNGDWVDIDAEIFVNPNANLDCEINVAAPNFSELPSSIDVAMAGEAVCDLEIEIDVLANNIRSAYLDSEIEIIGYPDERQLDSELFIMYWDQQAKLDSELTVVRDPLLGCYVYIL